uniref:DUF2518 family protein n=1 Tax=Cyanoptyche gloeocystis TaxID=77922 RepID=A0A3G1IWC4_9EUKA|nr:hypothetical protein Ycf51 [Cyanoptyche gloeocystis]
MILTNSEFFKITQDLIIFTFFLAIISFIGLIKKWKIRFQIVGITTFLGLVSISFFILSFIPFSHKIIQGSTKYSVIFDNGGSDVVIAVSAEIKEEQLKATLKQAANDLFSPGRLTSTQGEPLLTIKARTITNEISNTKTPLYLGEITRSFSNKTEETIEINHELLNTLKKIQKQ